MGNANTYTYNLPVDDTQYMSYPIRTLRDTTPTYNAYNQTLVRVNPPTPYFGLAYKIDILRHETITQVYVHYAGTLFFSSISNNVYTILNNGITPENTLMRQFKPKNGMLVTRVVTSGWLILFLFNNGRVGKFHIMKNKVTLMPKRFKVENLATTGQGKTYMVKKGGKEVYRDSHSLQYETISNYAGRIAKIGAGEFHMSILTEKGHVFFAGCNDNCHWKVHRCPNQIEHCSQAIHKKITFRDMAVAKIYSLLLPFDEAHRVYCIDASLNHVVTSFRFNDVEKVIASGGTYYYVAKSHPLKLTGADNNNVPLDVLHRFDWQEVGIKNELMLKKTQIVSFHVDLQGYSYLIIEPVPVIYGFIRGGN